MNAEVNQKQVPNKFCDALDAVIRSIGHVVMWTNGILILVIILQVVLRYGFGRGLVVLEELQWHLYALGIMFGASYAQMMDSPFHPRSFQVKRDKIHLLYRFVKRFERCPQ